MQKNNGSKEVFIIPMIVDLDSIKENGKMMGLENIVYRMIKGKLRPVMEIPGSEDQYKTMMSFYENESKKESRSKRCLIPSKYIGLKRCPEGKKCVDCDYYRNKNFAFGDATFSDLASVDNNGSTVEFDPAAPSSYLQGDREIRILKDLSEHAEKMYEGYSEILVELYEGKSQRQIARERNIPQRTLSSRIKKLNAMAKELMENLDY